MNLHVRFCEKCGKGYDIGTEFAFCSECRIKGRIKNEGRNFRRNII